MVLSSVGLQGMLGSNFKRRDLPDAKVAKSTEAKRAVI